MPKKKTQPLVLEHNLKLLNKIFKRNLSQKLACIAWFELNETFCEHKDRWGKSLEKACKIMNVDYTEGNRTGGYENGIEACFNKMKGKKKLDKVSEARAWVMYLATKCDMDGGPEFEDKMLSYYDVIFKNTGVEW